MLIRNLQLAGSPQAIARIAGRTSPDGTLKHWGKELTRPARVDTPVPKLCPDVASKNQRTSHKHIPQPKATPRFTGSFCASFKFLPTGTPCGTLTTWGMPSLALMPSPGAGLNTTGNIMPPSASPMGLGYPDPILSFRPRRDSIKTRHNQKFHIPFLWCTSGLLSSLS